MSDKKWAVKRFSIHRAGAKRRGIDFELTFDQWYHWWLAQGVDKNYPYKPGRRSTPDQLCMCRKGDCGPYRLDNIYCATQHSNAIDRHKNKPNTHTPPNKGIRGAVKQSQETIEKRRPKLIKRIQTPLGIFPSRKEAGLHYGIDPTAINYRLKKYPKEYYYV